MNHICPEGFDLNNWIRGPTSPQIRQATVKLIISVFILLYSFFVY